jgi:hypothetical protein
VNARYRGLLHTHPGRITLRVRIPADILRAAERLAAERQTDRDIVLGDLVAHELPDALAEAARERLTRSAHQGKKNDDPGTSPRVVSEMGHQTLTPVHSLPVAWQSTKQQVDVSALGT